MKKRKILRTISPFIVTIPFITISCNSNNYTDDDTYNVYFAFLRNELDIQINKSGLLTIEEIQKSDFSFAIKSNIDKSQSPNYYENLNNSLSKSKITCIDFFIPKINDDENSYLLLKINNSNKVIELQLKEILNNNKNIEYQKLQEKTIEELINKKLNSDKNFIYDLRILLNNEVIKNYQNNKGSDSITLIEYWNSNNLQTIIEQKLINFFDEKYLCFNNTIYNNIVISNLLITSLDNEKINISFGLTTDLTIVNSSYKIELTLWNH